jgi:XTP/dITP diphosphohydrolase/tetrapyrrole methylase family protein/MazG family protein
VTAPAPTAHFTAAGLNLQEEDRAAAHAERWSDFVAIVRRLRRDCPWDREQTNDSVKHLTIEEAYELVHAIDRGDDAAMAKELGDLLLHVVFHAHIAETNGHFTLLDVIEAESAKLVRRHPHVFGDVAVADTGEVLRNWEAIKRAERASEATASEQTSTLDGVPDALPALLRAQRVQEKAAAVGFDFPVPSDALAKVEEEVAELREMTGDDAARLEEEFGDLFFALVNYARLVGITPENALRKAVGKFTRRFRHVEARLAEAGRSPADAHLAEMDAFWDEAKRQEKSEAD